MGLKPINDLLAEAKSLAARTGRTLTQVIEDALRATMSGRDDDGTAVPELPVVRGGRLRPGVNLDSMSELLDVMESDEAP